MDDNNTANLMLWWPFHECNTAVHVCAIHFVYYNPLIKKVKILINFGVTFPHNTCYCGY